MLLYEMLFGCLPFSLNHKESNRYTNSILALKIRFPFSSKVSSEARDLILRILVPEDKRISLLQIQNHPWNYIPLKNKY